MKYKGTIEVDVYAVDFTYQYTPERAYRPDGTAGEPAFEDVEITNVFLMDEEIVGGCKKIELNSINPETIYQIYAKCTDAGRNSR